MLSAPKLVLLKPIRKGISPVSMAPANVSGVVVVYTLSNSMYSQARQDAAANGKRLPTISELRAIYDQFGYLRFPQSEDRLYSWSTDSVGWNKNAMKNLRTGQEADGPIGFGHYANCNAI